MRSTYGLEFFSLQGTNEDMSDTHTNPITHMSFFQCTFAATCVTIVSGAIAERCNFNGYIIFCVLVTGVTYPIAAHWCWGPSGWLSDLGFVDFAGSGVVHLSGGVCALVGTSFHSHTCSAFY